MSRFLWFIFCLIISAFCSLGICIAFGLSSYTDILMNYTSAIAIIAATIGTAIWLIKYKDSFTSFLIFSVFTLFNLLSIYVGPLTVDRSLSTFMYFYAAEKGSISTHVYNTNYFKDFSDRRIEDGVKFGFLSCTQTECKATPKGQLFYHILYPIGKITKTDVHYQNFKQTFD